MRFLFALALTALGGVALMASCSSSGSSGDTSSQTLCDAGENIFCRCPGGEAGTKTCKADGQSFEACVTRTGPCPEIPMTTSSSSSGEGGGATTGVGGGGAGGSGGGAQGLLYDACGKDEDCASGLCPMGFCTKECAKFDECTLGTGECVKLGGALVCTPLCAVTSQCENAYGEPSACGYANAVDGTPVITCADWKEDLELPPGGSDCEDDDDCHLGNDGVQRVCAFQACTEGCYVQSDCPAMTTCSSMGALGSCN